MQRLQAPRRIAHAASVSDLFFVQRRISATTITDTCAPNARSGTYSAVISPNKYYGAEFCDFDESHKVFRDMMPNFAWEVLEVYSGPPTVVCKWRHWGWMRGDYVGKNEDGDIVTIKAHGGIIDIQGVTVAKVNDKFQVESLETWFDPKDMFEQMRPSAETMSTMKMAKVQCPMGYSATMGKTEL